MNRDRRQVNQQETMINPYNGQPYSQRYFALQEERMGLPVWEYRQKFLDCLSKNRCMVVVGETGSGKTTQIPQLCLDYAKQLEKTVVCTQPRRVAATSVADRVAKKWMLRIEHMYRYSELLVNLNVWMTRLKIFVAPNSIPTPTLF